MDCHEVVDKRILQASLPAPNIVNLSIPFIGRTVVLELFGDLFYLDQAKWLNSTQISKH
jgi:hypothetical protein